MTTSNFDPEISNANLNSPQYYIDDDGSLKFISPYLASSNFDGIISVVEGPITAQNIKAGMLLQVISGQYYSVVSVAYDDPDLETSANIITVGYLDSLNELNTIDYNFTDSVNVRYEDWANKVMGSQGWTITSGGNAIFTNVAVRGRIEAEEGWISGNLTIGENGTDILDNVLITGDAANDINTNITTINGGKITTGSITADKINVNDLTVGKFNTGQIGDASYNIAITDNIDVTNHATFVLTNASNSNKSYIWYTEDGGLQIACLPQNIGGGIGSNNINFNFYPRWTGTQWVSTGSVTIVNGDLNVQNAGIYAQTISAGYFYGDGSGLTNLPAPANVVLTTGTYSNPTWISSLAGSKISGTVSDSTKLNGQKIASGTATTPGANDTVTVNFGITFTSTPIVTCSTFNAANYYAVITGATTTSVTLRAIHREASGAAGYNISLRWIAIGDA